MYNKAFQHASFACRTVCKSQFCGFATQKFSTKKPTYKLRLNSALEIEGCSNGKRISAISCAFVSGNKNYISLVTQSLFLLWCFAGVAVGPYTYGWRFLHYKPSKIFPNTIGVIYGVCIFSCSAIHKLREFFKVQQNRQSAAKIYN